MKSTEKQKRASRKYYRKLKNKIRQAAYYKKYYQKNKEKYLQRQRDKKDEINAYQRAWRAKNKE